MCKIKTGIYKYYVAIYLIAKHQLEEDRIKVLALEKKGQPLSDEEERYLANLKKITNVIHLKSCFRD